MDLFCIRCGARLEQREAFGAMRGVCPNCGHVHFDDPKVAVGLVIEHEGGIVLCRRGLEPKRGLWSFPSGYVDAGEVLEDAAAREAWEETGLVVAVSRLLGAFSEAGERVIFLAYAGRSTGGELTVGEECLDVRRFEVGALPPLAFDHDTEILEMWSKLRDQA